MTRLIVRDPFQNLIRSTFGNEDFRSVFDNEEGLLPLDISRKGDDLIVRASLPGFAKEDIAVEVHEGVLSIKAEHRSDEEIKDERYHRRERRSTSLSRRVALPGIFSEADPQATLENGVLTLQIPVSEAAKPRKVEIH